MVFNQRKPAARVIKSPMGGGWIVPATVEGEHVLTEYFGEGPCEIPPLGGRRGWIVEPQDAADLAEYLKSENIAWEVE